MILDVLVQYTIEIVGMLVITAVSLFGIWLLEKLKQKQGLQNITMATDIVLKAVNQTVLELQQTYVNAWKNKQEGKLTQEQVAFLKDRTKTITIDKLAEPVIKLIEAGKVDLEALITSEAEAAVLALKGN